jgi:hypothetical protein
VNVNELENIIEEYKKFKDELIKIRQLERKKVVIARAILDDESLICDLINCFVKLKNKNIIEKKEYDSYMNKLQKMFAKQGLYFIKPFGR